MKKRIILSLLTIFTFSLFGCNNPNTSSSSSSSISESVTVENKAYLLYTSSDNLKIKLNVIEQISSVKINDEEINTSDYNYDNSLLIISNTLVKGLGYGKHSVLVNNEHEYIAVVYDTKEPELTSDQKIYYVGGIADMEFIFNFYSYSFKSMTLEDVDYSDYVSQKNNSLIINPNIFAQVGGGTKNFIIKLDNDTPTGFISKDFSIKIVFPKSA